MHPNDRNQTYRVGGVQHDARRRDIVALAVMVALMSGVMSGWAASGVEREPVAPPAAGATAAPAVKPERVERAKGPCAVDTIIQRGHESMESAEGARRQHEIASGAKLVALTFDDGPWPASTESILSVLDHEDVPATFFMLGLQAKRYPRIARLVSSAGHQVGNHTYSHSQLSALSGADAWKDIQWGQKTILKATGHPAIWFRPPYGDVDARSLNVARQLSQRVVMWTVDSKDWERPGTDVISGNVLRAVKPGAIVLMHDGGGNRTQTVQALPGIIRELKRRGYVFVTIDELVSVNPPLKKK